MLDHRMRRVAAELLVDAQLDRPRRRTVELERALALIGLDAVERLQKVGLPGGAAISRSSTALRSAAAISFLSRLARASRSALERSRLPT
jgi:hypothetical protein